MNWTIYFTNKCAKQVNKLKSKKALLALRLLTETLKTRGQNPGERWPNYGKLKGTKLDCRHCHLIKGNPTYVCCWRVIDKSDRIIEVYYVGTHEKAPY